MAVDFLLSALLGYLLGSIPSAFLLVRWKSSQDIRQAGSGNVGALNSYLVTHSRWVGAAVLLLDFLKGVLSVLLAQALFGGGLITGAASGVASVVGHNFPVWLAFQGGRGLSTAAGVSTMLAWPAVPIWMALWGAGFLLTRDVNTGNALATLLLAVGALVMPADLLAQVVSNEVPVLTIRLLLSVMFLVILVRHISPVREYWRRRRDMGSPESAEAEAEKGNV